MIVHHPSEITDRPFELRAGFRRVLACVAGLVLALTAQAKPATNDTSTTDLVWPPAPNPPRVRFVQILETPASFGLRRSFWGRVSQFLTGNQQTDATMKPFGLAVDEDENLLLTDTGHNTVSYFDRAEKKMRRWEKIGPYEFASPVAAAKHKDTLFVADSELRAVIVFDVQGKFYFAITNGLQRPAGLAVTDEKLFVADAGAHRIVVFDLRGQKLSEFGRRGMSPGEFNFPTHLAVDRNARLLVTDSMNSRVQILDQSGQPLAVIGSVGDGSGSFSRPKGVATDSYGHVYVADALFDNIQVFDQQGRFLMHFGAAGHLPGEFWLPGGIAISRDNRIYVADTYNRRVQVFQYVGQE